MLSAQQLDFVHDSAEHNSDKRSCSSERHKTLEVPMEGRDLGREGASDGAGPAPSKRVVILVGPCGSGKSTFAHELMSRAPRWVRVCQDTISKGGKRGSRAQCVKALRKALAEGKSVLVDRCHVTPEQRREFVGVARDDPGVTAIDAVVFDFPLQVLQHRVKYRINHEGGVEGPRGAIVCATMRKQLMVRSNQPSE